MKINRSGARFSAIVGIGEKIKKLSEETGEEYLYLNRGVNSVCSINLTEVIEEIDFNSPALQVYPKNSGMDELKEAINQEYFGNHASIDNLTITAGSMGGLDLIFQTLDVKRIWLPTFFWGAYGHISTIRKRENEMYESFDDLKDDIPSLQDAAVVICDPNNPLGNKYEDEQILSLVRELNNAGVIVIFDSPYRRVFYDHTDTMFQDLMDLPNVIIIESFSKSVGLSGQRLGFIHSVNTAFNDEFRLRILYSCNGVNAFAQLLVLQLLISEKGKKAVQEFKEITTMDIRKNIDFLKEKKLLAAEFYKSSEPKGIFVIINKSEEELFKHHIGSVSLSFFTRTRKEEAARYARICVSVPHSDFVRFLTPLAAR
jgi:aspartate/methionine/tyrosine aminotransferase